MGVDTITATRKVLAVNGSFAFSVNTLPTFTHHYTVECIDSFLEKLSINSYFSPENSFVGNDTKCIYSYIK